MGIKWEVDKGPERMTGQLANRCWRPPDWAVPLTVIDNTSV